MITAQDVKSGYDQKKDEPNISVCPFLKAQEAKKEKVKAEKAAGTKPTRATNSGDLSQYDKARLEILRG